MTQWEQSLQKAPAGEKPVRNIMVDFETFGLEPETCGIMSAAIVGFDPLEGEGEARSFFASLLSNWLSGRDVSGCQEWWNHKDRSLALSIYLEQASCTEGATIGELEQGVVAALEEQAQSGDCIVLWSQGDFDIAILKAIYRRAGAKFPVPYYNVRDARTFILEHHIDESLFTGAGTEHVALDDCRSQIRKIQYINRALRGCGFYKSVDAITAEENHRRLKRTRRG